MIAAVIKDGVVMNLLEVDSLDIIPGLIPGDGAAIGDVWDGVVFKRGGSAVGSTGPQQVTHRQFRLVLLDLQKLDQVPAAIQALAEPQRSVMDIEWNFPDGGVVTRTGTLAAFIGQVLLLDAPAMNAVFVKAATL